jgi:hypothetical protein
MDCAFFFEKEVGTPGLCIEKMHTAFIIFYSIENW